MFKGARFIISQDEFDKKNGLVHVFDQETMMVVGYFDEDDLTSKEVCKYCNQLNHDIMSRDERIATLEKYSNYDTEDMLGEIKMLENKVQKEKEIHFLELEYCKDTLDELITNATNPTVIEALLLFKQYVNW